MPKRPKPANADALALEYAIKTVIEKLKSKEQVRTDRVAYLETQPKTGYTPMQIEFHKGYATAMQDALHLITEAMRKA